MKAPQDDLNKTIIVDLPPALEKWIDFCVSTRGYTSAQDYLLALLQRDLAETVSTE